MEKNNLKLNKIKVVVIDDVEDILELISYNLNREGIEVVSFTSPLKAVEYIRSNNTDVVVSDWMMPEIDGIEVCTLLKTNSLTRHIPFIMLSCNASLREYKSALKAGANDYVVKPVRMEEIVRRIKLLLATTKKYRSLNSYI